MTEAILPDKATGRAAWPLIGFYMRNADVEHRRTEARLRMRAGIAAEGVRLRVERRLVNLHASTSTRRRLDALAGDLRELADNIDTELALIADLADDARVSPEPASDVVGYSTDPFGEAA